MKKIILFATLLFSGTARSQVLNVSAGVDFTIMSGTIFSADGLTLVPSADFTITNNSLSKFTTVNHTTANPYILRVYQFTNSTNPYSGSVQVNYTDGAELNGIPENTLTLTVHNGTLWNTFAAGTRDGTNNFVLTNGISNATLNELTLTAFSAPLPVEWLSFTATRQNQTSLLQWSTAQEQNTLNFIIQHSINGINWTDIGLLPAAGNSSSQRNYSYIHFTPVTGINYYRILQTDLNNRNSYSVIRTLRFTKTDASFTITGNPVTNGILIVQVNRTTEIFLYTADGKLLWQEHANTGTKNIDVSRYAKGIYFLKAGNSAQKVMIQ
jgi:hypothetical protein